MIRYEAMRGPLFEVLQVILPCHDDDISNLISTYANTGFNGYELMWYVFRHVVPGFDNKRRTDEPEWKDYMNVTKFSRAFTTYVRIQRVVGAR